jgi:hypothetical protein
MENAQNCSHESDYRPSSDIFKAKECMYRIMGWADLTRYAQLGNICTRKLCKLTSLDLAVVEVIYSPSIIPKMGSCILLETNILFISFA